MRAVLCLLLATALPAAAQVTCTATVQNLTFGVYDPRSPRHNDTVGNIQVNCSGVAGRAVNYAIRLNSGGSGSLLPRKMKSGASALAYNIYLDAARAVVWGDGNSGTSFVSDAYVLPSGNVTRNFPVYGRLFAGQNAPVGTYVDSITLTLSF